MSSMFHLRKKRKLQGSIGRQLRDLNSLQGNKAPLRRASTILLRIDNSESIRLPITHHRGTSFCKTPEFVGTKQQPWRQVGLLSPPPPAPLLYLPILCCCQLTNTSLTLSKSFTSFASGVVAASYSSHSSRISCAAGGHHASQNLPKIEVVM